MYQTLYRKYRPKTFDDVCGQKVIVQTLKNSIMTGRISHANMFIGPRGTGKTSVAKIFSRAVNCQQNNNGDLCGSCVSCSVSEKMECLDIIEIDAASNNGVDEIRELRDKVNLVPASLKYKVYIIDEVHMLTVQAFNALLKTLEEPPEHAIFILATTDPQKVPETIISRCQCYNFGRISEGDIVYNLKKICDFEKIKCSELVLSEIAVISDGGMRDSIGMLDKLISYSQNDITIDDFYMLNNIVSKTERDNFVSLIINGDLEKIIDIIERWSLSGVSIVQTLIKVLYDLKEKIVDYYVNDNDDINSVVEYERLAIFLNENLEKMKKSSDQKIYVEINLLKYINQIKKNENSIETPLVFNAQNVVNPNISREIKKEKNISQEEISCQNISREIDDDYDRILNIKRINEIRINNAFATADKNSLKDDKEKILKLNDFVFDQDFGYLVCILLDGKIKVSSQEYIVFSYEYPSMVEEHYNKLIKLNEILCKYADIDKKIALVTDDEWNVLKNDYITKLKNGQSYDIMIEPKLEFDEFNEKKTDKHDIINSATSIFGKDIVEID